MNSQPRVLSAIKPNGRLHIGHYYSALNHWKRIQYEYDCFFMIADVHSLMHQHEINVKLSDTIEEIVIDWLAAGIDPSQATIFVQSKVPEHFELSTLLGTITPLSWLERVPNYKEKIDHLEHTDLSTYGFL